ncbi:MAG: DUF1841 family protein [Sulfuricella sp.]|nr:DUF1841 family protein [Sulfuricella sp.]
MFSPSRDQARRFLFDAWKKHKEHAPLTDLERMALAVMLLHPEYHPQLDNPDQYLERDYPPESGETNPFLHLSLHLSIREQLSIDQPRGVVAHYRKLLEKNGDEHQSEHALLECLGEMIWQAQRNRTQPDPAVYFACLTRMGGEPQ